MSATRLRSRITRSAAVALATASVLGAFATDNLTMIARLVFIGAAFLTTLLADAYEEVFALIRAKGGTVAVDTGWPPSGRSMRSR